MAKTERELAFIRDLAINETWTKRFTDVIDKHIDLKGVDNILYVNAGTGDHCIAIAERADDRTAVFAACENAELLKIAKDKGAAVKADIDFSKLEFEDDSFARVIAEASFTPFGELEELIRDSVRVARSGGRVAITVPSAGSFGEILSLLWEVLFNEDLGEHGAAVEEILSRIPTVSRIEEIAGDAGLVNIKTETAKEVFEYENGAEFVSSPLIADFLLPAWLEMLGEKEKERVSEKLAQLIDVEDGNLSFRFTVKVTLLTGEKSKK